MGFRRAVPRRKDRGELRRTLRAATREMRREKRRSVTASLEALVVSRSRVGTVRCGPAGSTSLVFVDGTVLDLSVREGEVGLQRLAGVTPPVIYLRAVEPCFGKLWYRLYFVSLFEERCVMAKVTRLDRASNGTCPGRGEDAGRRER